MFLKLLGCWCIAFSFSGVESQEVRNSFDGGYDSRFLNNWNSNNGFPIRGNRPSFGNTNNAGSNFFNSNNRPNANTFSSPGNEQNFKWGEQTVMNTDKTSDWNLEKPSKANNDRQSNAFDNRPNKKKLNSIMNLPNSSQWNANSNSFTSNSNKKDNSDFSSWGYNSAKPSSNQNNKRPESWNSNNVINNKTYGNDIFSESDYEDNDVYSSWGSNNNKKPKPTPNSYSSSGSRESTTKKSDKVGSSKWEAKDNKKPQKGSMSNSSQTGREPSRNPSPSTLDTSILDELDKNDWYFGKESNYPKPPFRSTLNIDVSELWNFDKNRKTNQNSQTYGNSAKVSNNNNKNNRRNRQIERMSGIHCECVSVNLCEEEDMIITQEDLKFELRPIEEFTCERLTDVCCTNPKKEKLTNEEDFIEEKQQLQCGQTKAEGINSESFENNIAGLGEFPWILRLEKAEINCSASLIHPKMALTAAHCVTSAQPGELTLKAGVWNSNNEPSQSRIVTKIIQHPGYNSRNPRNDIALLVLEIPFELTDNVNTICLPMTNDRWDPNQCVIAGWRSEKILGQVTEVLEKEIINFLPQTECQNMMLVTDLWRNYILHDSFICGLGKTTTKSCIVGRFKEFEINLSCLRLSSTSEFTTWMNQKLIRQDTTYNYRCYTGDEGGFVICPFKNKPRTYLQIGIVSMGINCDNFGRPGIFTNALKFLDWIYENYMELGLFDVIDTRNSK